MFFPFVKHVFSFLNWKSRTDGNMKPLSVIICLYSIIELFVGTFLLAYFFKVSGENITVIGIYYLVYYATLFILSLLTGPWLKSCSKMEMYRWGCICELIFFTVVWLIKENVSRYIVLLGILYGMTSSLRYFARNLTVSENITEQKMIKFQGYIDAGCNILKIVSPLVLGFFLTVDSLNKVMVVLGGLVLMDFCLSFQITERPFKHKVKFNIYNCLYKTFQNKEVRYIYYMEIFRGFTISGVLNIVATLYIVYLFHTNFNLGGLTSLFALASVLMNVLFGRYGKYHYFVKLIAFASLISVGTSLLFVYLPSRETFVFYNLCFVTATRLLLIITNINMYNTANIKKVKLLFRVEYFAIREMLLNIGRILGCLILLGIGLCENFELLRYFLLFLTICMGIMGYCSCMINKSRKSTAAN